MLVLNVHVSMLTAEQLDCLNKFMDSLPYDPREKPKERAARKPLLGPAFQSQREWTVEEILQREG
jgi:hypothetical protein